MASSVIQGTLGNPAKLSSISPEIDTIEYLDPAISYTASDNAKLHANIVPFIDIKIGILDQRNGTLKKKISLKSSNLVPVLSSSIHGSRKDNILSSVNLVWHHGISAGSS